MKATLSHCVLRVARIDECAGFMGRHFGFDPDAVSTHDRVLLMPRSGSACLELLRSPDDPRPRAACTAEDGYWKLGFTCDDVVRQRERLAAHPVGPVARFEDVGVMCHLADPDGFPIELLDRHVGEARVDTPGAADDCVTFAHVTLRVREAEASLRFYRDLLGLRVLSTQRLPGYEFTLYFLAATDELAPPIERDPVAHREWLWSRPYTCLELQHFWGSRARNQPYRLYHEAPHGFWGLGFEVPDLEALLAGITAGAVTPHRSRDPLLDRAMAVMHDPDGYALRLQQAA